ncbi:flagellar protein FliT [Burkholderia multivorans]|uniref:flagellar protein FliT n=1 Tax=Burkholderia ubonensis TaxID=101571 RepID=UPI000F70331D|nr:flagellar protein FliT [Burkholderia ubonensis]AYZ66628.1 flagellar protein FliT [Burkholderia multivorans]VWC37129.1 flagellar biosynthesis protein FliT [Burkholderia ubonensis]
MNRKDEYFARYEAIAAVSGRMLHAARGADWNALSGLQEEYLQLVDGLKEAGQGIALDEVELARKLDLIRRILADDAAIRDLASPEIARLSALFETQRSTKVLTDLYRARARG